MRHTLILLVILFIQWLEMEEGKEMMVKDSGFLKEGLPVFQMKFSFYYCILLMKAAFLIALDMDKSS